MGRRYLSKNEKVILKEDLSINSIKNIIKELTDEDFNGNNGEDYYTKVEIDGKIISMSKLDAAWYYETHGKSEKEIIEDACNIIQSIVSSNYEDDYYYEDSFVRVIETSDSIVCVIVCMYYN